MLPTVTMDSLYTTVLSRYWDAAILGGRYRIRSITNRHQVGFCIEMISPESTKPTLLLTVLIHGSPASYGLTIRSEQAWYGLRADCSAQAVLAFLDTGDPCMIYPDGYPQAQVFRQRLTMIL